MWWIVLCQIKISYAPVCCWLFLQLISFFTHFSLYLNMWHYLFHFHSPLALLRNCFSKVKKKMSAILDECGGCPLLGHSFGEQPIKLRTPQHSPTKSQCYVISLLGHSFRPIKLRTPKHSPTKSQCYIFAATKLFNYIPDETANQKKQPACNSHTRD